MTTTEYLKGTCVHCHAPIEFPAEQSDAIAECPHCQKETVLRKTVEYRADLEKDRNVRRYVLMAAGAVGLIAAMWAFISILGPAASAASEASGAMVGGVLALTLLVFVVVLAVLWLVLPFVIYFGFQHARKNAEAANDLIRGCLHRLEEIAGRGRKP